MQKASKRELFEKTGVVAEKDLEEAGILDFRYIQEDTNDIFVHAVAFVFKYNFLGDKQLLSDAKTRYGQLSWSKLGRSHILPEVYALKELVDLNKYSHISKDFVEPGQMPVFVAP
jgi:hypothetical protein